MMELQGNRRRREASPNMAKLCMQSNMKMFKKVQVVYYLSRNGQLEHPHFMEVSHLAGQELRLKDVTDRLCVLRGRGMPSLFSWSCKRTYRNGYVWKDLAEDDVIYPAEGSEYVLKGSELIEGCAERFQQLHVSSRQPNTDTIYHSKRIQQLPATLRLDMGIEGDGADADYKEQEEMARMRSNRHGGHGRGHLHPRRSHCVANDESEDTLNPKPHQTHHPTVLTLDDTASPPSTSSTPSDKAPAQPAGRSQLFTDQVPAYPSVAGRASVLLTLLTCGTGSARRNPSPAPADMLGGGSGRISSVQQGVVVRRVMEEEEEIRYMSENPRFGNQPAVEKEYFSGSIVEAAGEDHRAEPGLKRSASYNEERSKDVGMAQREVEEDEMKNTGEGCNSLTGKCIPRRVSKHRQPKK